MINQELNEMKEVNPQDNQLGIQTQERNENNGTEPKNNHYGIKINMNSKVIMGIIIGVLILAIIMIIIVVVVTKKTMTKMKIIIRIASIHLMTIISPMKYVMQTIFVID